MAQTLAKMVNLEASYDPLLTPASDQEECGGPPCYSEPEPSQASGLRLSWPQEGNSKRARVGKLPSRGKYAQDARVHHSHIVQVSHRDIEMHYHLNNAGAPSARPFLEVPMPWNPTSLEVDHQDLLQYFRHTASKALAIFGHDAQELGGVLIRIAMSSTDTLSTAVLQALLAFAALHRHDIYPQAVELKIAAIKTLRSASSDRMSAAEATRHVAAGMLLSSFEIHQASCTSGEWTWYLRGVKNVVRAAGLDALRPQDGDLAVLLDWVYYHDVLARFSLRHWHRDFKPAPWSSSASSPPSMPANLRAEPSQSAPPALALIELLSEVCDAVSGETPPANTADHANYLKILDWRIRTTTIAPIPDESPDAPLIRELYQLAMLVYLSRAHPKLNPPTKTQRHIDRGFEILARLQTCDRQFPVFVLGCEARTDERRAAVLDLLARTERGVASRSLNYCGALVRAVWAQDDLADGEIGYLDKLSCVMSCCRIVPTLV